MSWPKSGQEPQDASDSAEPMHGTKVYFVLWEQCSVLWCALGGPVPHTTTTNALAHRGRGVAKWLRLSAYSLGDHFAARDESDCTRGSHKQHLM